MTDFIKELQDLRDLGQELVDRTSRLLAEQQEQSAPVEGKTKKRKRRSLTADEAFEKYRLKFAKKAGLI